MTSTTPRIGIATREGTAADNADAAKVYQLADGTVGAAVIDGIGHGPHTSATAPLLAEVAARITARRGPLAGLLTAADLVADPGADGREADAVAVVAQITADRSRIAWVGDCRAYTWDGEDFTLHLRTTDQTMGQWARIHHGVPIEVAEHHDAWVRVSLATATVTTTREVGLPEGVRLVLLLSDGVHGQASHDDLTALVHEHANNPQALADALVAAAEADDDGYRDDATAIVIATQ
ncbi:SpoIIE family protein phosphatase [Streptomyces buecherae]|uniref:SpoIIE family protein phosphatase n=1 Tax=Streptomyces buecherae TaxID=2763006 RepID=UPI003652584E